MLNQSVFLKGVEATVHIYELFFFHKSTKRDDDDNEKCNECALHDDINKDKVFGFCFSSRPLLFTLAPPSFCLIIQHYIVVIFYPPQQDEQCH